MVKHEHKRRTVCICRGGAEVQGAGRGARNRKQIIFSEEKHTKIRTSTYRGFVGLA